MPAPFIGQFGFTQDRLSQMLIALQQEESERRRMQMQLAMEKARINAENARLKLAERQFEWEQEEIPRAREAQAQQAQMQQAGALAQTQMEQQSALEQERIKQLGQIETERIKFEAPRFMTVVNTTYYADPTTGEFQPVAIAPEGIILKYGERLIEKSTGDLLAESEDVQQDKYYIYGLRGGELVSRAPKIPTPEGTYGVNTPEGNIIFRDLETDEFAGMIMTSDPAVANQAAMLTAQAKAQEVEYSYVVDMAKLDTAKEMNWATLISNERIEAAKRVGENFDRALTEQRIRIERGYLVLDRDKMYQEAKTARDRQDLDRYVADLEAKTLENVEGMKNALGYAGLDTQTFLRRIELASAEKVAWWNITSTEDIANLDRAVRAKAVEVTERGLEIKESIAKLLELGVNKRAELQRKLTLQLATIQARLGYKGLDMKETLAKLERETAAEERVWKAEEAVKVRGFEAEEAAREREFERREAVLERDWKTELSITLQEMQTEGKLTPQAAAMWAALKEMSPEDIATIGKRLLEPKEEGEYTGKIVGGELIIINEKTGDIRPTGIKEEDVEPILMNIWDKVMKGIKSEWTGVWGPSEVARAQEALTNFIETDPRLTEEQRQDYLTRVPGLAGIVIEPGVDTELSAGDKLAEWLKGAAKWLYSVPSIMPKTTVAPSKPSLEAIVREAERIATGAGTNEEKRTKILELYRKRGVTEEQINEYRRGKRAK